MIEGATARREVGDWRGACAAARFEVAFDLDGLRRGTAGTSGAPATCVSARRGAGRLPDGAPRLRAASSAGAGLPRLDVRVWARQPDLELIRLGRLDPDELHPLVAAALFPRRAPSPAGNPSERVDLAVVAEQMATNSPESRQNCKIKLILGGVEVHGITES
jgi:hypothetical protein